MEPEPLTRTRRLYSARPLCNRSRRNLAGPGPRLTICSLTVRAPDITASAVARSSSKCLKSCLLLKVDTARLAVAVLPSVGMGSGEGRVGEGGRIRGAADH